ncbi:MAG: hypothetical protein ACYC6T_09845 [Thermoleophilia bacterium]
MNDAITKQTTMTVGLDLGDRYIHVCILDEAGAILEESEWVAFLGVAHKEGTLVSWMGEKLSACLFVALGAEKRNTCSQRSAYDPP